MTEQFTPDQEQLMEWSARHANVDPRRFLVADGIEFVPTIDHKHILRCLTCQRKLTEADHRLALDMNAEMDQAMNWIRNRITSLDPSRDVTNDVEHVMGCDGCLNGFLELDHREAIEMNAALAGDAAGAFTVDQLNREVDLMAKTDPEWAAALTEARALSAFTAAKLITGDARTAMAFFHTLALVEYATRAIEETAATMTVDSANGDVTLIHTLDFTPRSPDGEMFKQGRCMSGLSDNCEYLGGVLREYPSVIEVSPAMIQCDPCYLAAVAAYEKAVPAAD